MFNFWKKKKISIYAQLEFLTPEELSFLIDSVQASYDNIHIAEQHIKKAQVIVSSLDNSKLRIEIEKGIKENKNKVRLLKSLHTKLFKFKDLL